MLSCLSGKSCELGAPQKNKTASAALFAPLQKPQTLRPNKRLHLSVVLGSFENSRNALAATDTHSDQGITTTRAVKFVNGLGGNDGTGRPYGVT